MRCSVLGDLFKICVGEFGGLFVKILLLLFVFRGGEIGVIFCWGYLYLVLGVKGGRLGFVLGENVVVFVRVVFFLLCKGF